MSPQVCSVFHDVAQRRWNPAHAKYPRSSNPWLMQGLRLTNELKQHAGCVNSVAWNDDASLILTGSDDLSVCVWGTGTGFPCKGAVYTGHVHNIFSVEFVPNSNSKKCVTIAGDGDVRLIDLCRGFESNSHTNGTDGNSRNRPRRRWSSDPDDNSPFAKSLFNNDGLSLDESGMGMKVKFCPNDGSVFLTTHQDGKVSRFDLRLPTGPGTRNRNFETICDLSTQGSLSDLCFDPTNTTQFAVGCDDPYVRVFDLRKFIASGAGDNNSNSRSSGRASSPSEREHPSLLPVVAKYSPGKSTGFNTRKVQFDGVSGLAYSKKGELAVNYRGEHLYVIDRLAVEKEYKALLGGNWGDNEGVNGGHKTAVTDNAAQQMNTTVDGWAMDVSNTHVAWTSRATNLASPTALHPSRSPSPEFGYDNESDEDQIDSEVEEEQAEADELVDADELEGQVRQQIAERRSASLPRDRVRSQSRGRSATPGLATVINNNNDDPWSLFDDDPTLVSNPAVRRFTGHKNVKTFLKSVAFLCDDQYVATGGDCGSLFVWRKDTGALVQKMQADSQVVNNVCPHPVLPMLVTSGIDDTVRVWEPGEGKHLLETPVREVEDEDELAEEMLAELERGGHFTEVWNRLRRRGDSEEDEDEDEEEDIENTAEFRAHTHFFDAITGGPTRDSPSSSSPSTSGSESSDDDDDLRYFEPRQTNLGVPFTRAIRELVNAEARAEVVRRQRRGLSRERTRDLEEILHETAPDMAANALEITRAPEETVPTETPSAEAIPSADIPPTEAPLLRRSKRARSGAKPSL